MISIEEIIKRVEPIEGWLSSEVIELLVRAARMTPEAPIVEIGSWKGKSTVALSLATDKKIYAIDPFTGSIEHQHLYGEDVDTYNDFLKNISTLGNRDQINPLVMTSHEANKLIDEKISMLWIDGSHEFKDVELDFNLWFEQLVEGGVVLFHDSKWPGVKKVLWQDVYTNKYLGIIQRIEDTTFAFKKLKTNEDIIHLNLMKLDLAQKAQKIKRLKRKLNKWQSKNITFK